MSKPASTEKHPKLKYYTDAHLSGLRTKCDAPADALIAELFHSLGPQAMREIMRSLATNRDLAAAELPDALRSFYVDYSQLPDWANPRLMRQGSEFFERHAEPIMSMLGTLALPYCYAGADGAQVLFLSKRIYEDTPRRLLETGHFVLDVMDPGAFKNGRGFASALNVRLMHAAIRAHILSTDQWNFDWGHPINQEDMAGTIGAFSFVCVRGLRKAGYVVSYADAMAYQHLWNVVGHIMGVQNELLTDTGLEASRLDEAIRERHFRPSDAGRVLTGALLETLSKAQLKGLSPDFIPAYCRFLLGDEVADILGVAERTGNTKLPLNLMQWRNFLTSTLPLGDSGNLNKVRQRLETGQAENLVRFAVAESL